MKKKHVRRTHHHHHHTMARRGAPNDNYIVAVRGWMLVVAFALMLGVGAVVGSYISTQLELAAPSVAGVSTDR